MCAVESPGNTEIHKDDLAADWRGCAVCCRNVSTVIPVKRENTGNLSWSYIEYFEVTAISHCIKLIFCIIKVLRKSRAGNYQRNPISSIEQTGNYIPHESPIRIEANNSKMNGKPLRDYQF